MMKYRAACLSITAAALIGVAAAHKSQVKSPTAKSDADLHAATKPLAPKSAMPPKHSSSSAVPSAPKSNDKSNAELTHLEHQEIRAGGPSSGAAAKSAAAPKPASTGGGSGVNAKYQKPKGGMQASRPDAHTANSQKPRVKSH